MIAAGTNDIAIKTIMILGGKTSSRLDLPRSLLSFSHVCSLLSS
jgi:hypothetical protein